MKIFITTHGNYEDNHVSLCTTDFDKAVKHFLDYHRTAWCNRMSNFDIWENNEEYHSYGSWNVDIIHTNVNNLTYEDIKNDILKSLEKAGKSL